MKKTILTVLCSALIAATAMSAASAAEHHRVRPADRAQVQIGESVRNANAFAPSPFTYQSNGYNSIPYNGALSAPAGR